MTITDAAKKKMIDIALIAMSVLILIGVGLTIYFLNADQNVIKVNIEPDQTQTITFEHLALRPGESCEYTLSLNGEYSEEYQLSLNFSDHEPSHTLKSYVYVRIERDGTVLCDQLLSEAFDGEGITLTANFTDGAKNEMQVTFYMPEDVGNEAQNAEANFELLLKATNKG